MEHVERTGVHSGDSISVYPTFSVSEKVKQTILDYTRRLGLGIGIVGLFNIQFIAVGDEVYVIEVNPRSSRTVPFLSKATGIPIANIATKVILGHSLAEQGYTSLCAPERKRWYVKAPAFSFSKIRGLDAYLSPEMKSTGEAIGYDRSLKRALYKALQASGVNVANYGTIFVTIADPDKEEALPLIRRFYNLGFNIEATAGTAAFLKRMASGPAPAARSARAARRSSPLCGRAMSTMSSIPVSSAARMRRATDMRSAAARSKTTSRCSPPLRRCGCCWMCSRRSRWGFPPSMRRLIKKG